MHITASQTLRISRPLFFKALRIYRHPESETDVRHETLHLRSSVNDARFLLYMSQVTHDLTSTISFPAVLHSELVDSSRSISHLSTAVYASCSTLSYPALRRLTNNSCASISCASRFAYGPNKPSLVLLELAVTFLSSDRVRLSVAFQNSLNCLDIHRSTTHSYLLLSILLKLPRMHLLSSKPYSHTPLFLHSYSQKAQSACQ